MKIEDMTIEQLKVMAYDQLVLLQQTQNNINIIQAELARRYKDNEENKDKAEVK